MTKVTSTYVISNETVASNSCCVNGTLISELPGFQNTLNPQLNKSLLVLV